MDSVADHRKPILSFLIHLYILGYICSLWLIHLAYLPWIKSTVHFPVCFVFSCFPKLQFLLSQISHCSTVQSSMKQRSLLKISGCSPRKRLENYSGHINKLIMEGSADHVHRTLLHGSTVRAECPQPWKQTAGRLRSPLRRRTHFLNASHRKKQPCLAL